MQQAFSTVLSLKIGAVQTTPLPDSNRKTMVSAITKQPVQSATVSALGFDGDEHGDPAHHGGIYKAVFMLGTRTYAAINALCGTTFDPLLGTQFGENMVFADVGEEDICVGDIFRIGQVRLQVTQPRQPCWKLSASTHIATMTQTIFRHGLTGWYAKVLQEGRVHVNDAVILEERPFANLTIRALNQSLLEPKANKTPIQEALACDALGPSFRSALAKRAGNDVVDLSYQAL
ncbi:MAG: MOSC domain-containing protein [Campylobacterales bacterium]|nr:MOSC domain-containing protein [Campylobacterales bacterium]